MAPLLIVEGLDTSETSSSHSRRHTASAGASGEDALCHLVLDTVRAKNLCGREIRMRFEHGLTQCEYLRNNETERDGPRKTRDEGLPSRTVCKPCLGASDYSSSCDSETRVSPYTFTSNLYEAIQHVSRVSWAALLLHVKMRRHTAPTRLCTAEEVQGSCHCWSRAPLPQKPLLLRDTDSRLLS